MRLGRLGTLIAIYTLVVLSGCLQTRTGNSVSVMFDRPPLLFGDEVVFNGTTVGKVNAVEVGAGNIARVDFIPSSEFSSSLADNLVFYVNNGRLVAAKLRNFGSPLEKGAFLCGFNSKSSLYWFMLKNALGDSARAAMNRAAFLGEQFKG